MYAVIEIGKKQFKVEQGSILYVESLGISEGDNVDSIKTLAVNDGRSITFGKPYLDIKIHAKVLKVGKSKKIVVFKYKPKSNYKRKFGHRQAYNKVEITSIGQ